MEKIRETPSKIPWKKSERPTTPAPAQSYWNAKQFGVPPVDRRSPDEVCWKEKTIKTRCCIIQPPGKKHAFLGRTCQL